MEAATYIRKHNETVEQLTSNSDFSLCTIPSKSTKQRLNSWFFMLLLREPVPGFLSTIWRRELSTSENKSSARSITCFIWMNKITLLVKRKHWKFQRWLWFYLVQFSLYPILIIKIKVKFRRGEVDWVNIDWRITKASNHIRISARVRRIMSEIFIQN